MRRSFNGRGIRKRAVVIAALLAFLTGGSGQSSQAVACPSHGDSHTAAVDGPGRNGSERDGVVDHVHGSLLGGHESTHGSTRLDDASSPAEREGHPCTCVGTCYGSAAAERPAPQGLARQHGMFVPATLLTATSAGPVVSESSYLLPFANAPPVSI